MLDEFQPLVVSMLNVSCYIVLEVCCSMKEFFIGNSPFCSLPFYLPLSLLLSLSFHLQQKHDFLFHTARTMCIGWSPDSQFIASGSIDTNIIVWSLAANSRTAVIKGKVS